MVALPPEMRADAINDFLRQTRLEGLREAVINQAPAATTANVEDATLAPTIDQEFLNALPADIQEEVSQKLCSLRNNCHLRCFNSSARRRIVHVMPSSKCNNNSKHPRIWPARQPPFSPACRQVFVDRYSPMLTKALWRHCQTTCDKRRTTSDKSAHRWSSGNNERSLPHEAMDSR